MDFFYCVPASWRTINEKKSNGKVYKTCDILPSRGFTQRVLKIYWIFFIPETISRAPSFLRLAKLRLLFNLGAILVLNIRKLYKMYQTLLVFGFIANCNQDIYLFANFISEIVRNMMHRRRQYEIKSFEVVDNEGSNLEFLNVYVYDWRSFFCSVVVLNKSVKILLKIGTVPELSSFS